MYCAVNVYKTKVVSQIYLVAPSLNYDSRCVNNFILKHRMMPYLYYTLSQLRVRVTFLIKTF
jgi:hypothetical protein